VLGKAVDHLLDREKRREHDAMLFQAQRKGTSFSRAYGR